MVSDLLADAVAELYEADPDGFTERRAELAAAARDAGEPAAAKQITALRKPTRSAWVVNRLVRSDPDVRSRLDALAADLRAAAGSADGARIRELTAARARLVDELTRAALRSLGASRAARGVARGGDRHPRRRHRRPGGGRPPGHPGPRRALGRIRPSPAPRGNPAPAPARKTKTPAPAESETEREDRRREKIMEAERTLAQADQDVEAATAAERDLEEAVRHLEAELADARQRLAEARRQSYRAESRQQRAARQLSRLRE